MGRVASVVCDCWCRRPFAYGCIRVAEMSYYGMGRNLLGFSFYYIEIRRQQQH
ncbi:hypothetical protein HanRHA438_Chr00c40g0856831 [Helianthus annuus]|nr:hypothetical protein HanRHA438_Chr15g0726491 [Helianthus annuus]KAJ0953905.1 hypothetical protein HanRHA438_Chr00c40g0856831 [Helianthus annuus]